MDFLKRHGFFPTAQPGKLLTNSVRRFRCKQCGQECHLEQVNEKNNARVPVLARCPKHGLMKMHQVIGTIEFTEE